MFLRNSLITHLQDVFLNEYVVAWSYHTDVNPIIKALELVDDVNVFVFLVQNFDGHKTSLINAGGEMQGFDEAGGMSQPQMQLV